jgi:oligopeptidase A
MPAIATALLDPFALPAFDALQPDAILAALDQAIAAQQATVARIVADRPTAFAQIWLPLERGDNAIEALWSAVSHLRAVADTPELRAAYAEGQRRYIDYALGVSQNSGLYAVLETLRDSAVLGELTAGDRAAVNHSLRNRRLAGVALDEADRARFRDISLELSTVGTDFGNAILDATDAWSEQVTDEAVLAGLSDADKAMLAAAAAAKGQDGWRITLQQPSVSAILTFAEDRDLRARVYRAAGTRASDQGPHAGEFDNSPRIERLLALRREAAGLLGFADHVERSLFTKMASDGPEVLDFLRDLAARAKPVAERELTELRAYAAGTLGLADLEPWDIAFASNRLRQERHDVDEQAVRAYFPSDRVLAGWAELLGRLYGISLAERGDVALWHGDAKFYDVFDQDGTLIAGLYLDLFARPGKRGGAWMSAARPRIRDGAESRVPVAYLTCNFPPAGGDTPSLLSHADVTTLLHETGHCLHHLFTLVDRPSVAGIHGFEWDAVELPSQLMEDFAWDRDVLTSMSGHYLTGEPLPADLFGRLVAGRHFQSGMFIVRQLEFSLFDMLLHGAAGSPDPIAVIEAVRDEVAVIRPPAWHRFPHSFNHIFAGGYAAGYYSYLWAEVLAADGFRRFAEAGLVDRATGDLFRREVLSRGSTRPAAESFRAFRGRDPDSVAFLGRHGLR